MVPCFPPKRAHKPARARTGPGALRRRAAIAHRKDAGPEPSSCRGWRWIVILPRPARIPSSPQHRWHRSPAGHRTRAVMAPVIFRLGYHGEYIDALHAAAKPNGLRCCACPQAKQGSTARCRHRQGPGRDAVRIRMGQNARLGGLSVDAEYDPGAQGDDVGRHILRRHNPAALQLLHEYACGEITGPHPQADDFVEHEMVPRRDDDVPAAISLGRGA